ncbi:MAG TPA: DciA family protein [Acetobacteraceae bacterium]
MVTRMAVPERRVYGPQSLGGLLPRITRPAFRRHSPAAAQLMADWADIIGPALAAVTAPRRLVSGTLTLACSGPIALELQHLSTELIARLNGQLGSQTVHRLRFVQTAPPPAATAAATRPVDPAAHRAAEASVAHLPAGPLREALANLGGAVLGQLSTSAQGQR